MYTGSECVLIWLGVRRFLRPVRGLALPPPLLRLVLFLVLLLRPTPVSCAAVTSRVGVPVKFAGVPGRLAARADRTVRDTAPRKRLRTVVRV